MAGKRAHLPHFLGLVFVITCLGGLAAKAQTADVRGQVTGSRLIGSLSTKEIDRTNAAFYTSSNTLPARYAINHYLITFLTTDKDNAPVEAVAQLYVPRAERGTTFPIYVMGSGTTGLGDHCATSREQPGVRNWGNYRAHMLSYATQGFIAILPDYHGFNDPRRPHHYFVADLESRMLLDAARAVYRFFEQGALAVAPSPDVFLAGYSQGGHAVFAATDMAPTYAPELTIRGAIGYAPATSVEALLRDTPYLAPYILYAYADLYGTNTVEVAKKLQPRWLATFEEDVMKKCIDEVATYYGRDAAQVYRPEFLAALYNGRLADSFPALKAALDRNATGLRKSGIPSLVIQGGGDPIVTTPTQDVFVRNYCRLGENVTYLVYPEVHHFQARQFGYRTTLLWMQVILYGGLPSSDCEQFLAQTR